MVNKYWRQLLDLLAPCRCQLCGQLSARPLELCTHCQQSLALNTSPCPSCALPTPDGNLSPCGQCQRQTPSFTSTTAPYLYTEPLARFITQLKFSADRCQLPVLAELMSVPAQRAIDRHGRPDLLLPVPLHWRRRWQRGFNQASLLARQLSRHPILRHCHLQVDDTLCSRLRATPAQQGLARKHRLRNLSGAFSCNRNLEGQHLVIVDDVMTTGATAEALARICLDAGARRIDIWCCARTPAPSHTTPYWQCKAPALPPY